MIQNIYVKFSWINSLKIWTSQFFTIGMLASWDFICCLKSKVSNALQLKDTQYDASEVQKKLQNYSWLCHSKLSNLKANSCQSVWVMVAKIIKKKKILCLENCRWETESSTENLLSINLNIPVYPWLHVHLFYNNSN